MHGTVSELLFFHSPHLCQTLLNSYLYYCGSFSHLIIPPTRYISTRLIFLKVTGATYSLLILGKTSAAGLSHFISYHSVLMKLNRFAPLRHLSFYYAISLPLNITLIKPFPNRCNCFFLCVPHCSVPRIPCSPLSLHYSRLCFLHSVSLQVTEPWFKLDLG